MGTLQPAKYGKVVGRLVAIVGDGPDEDEYPVAGGFPDTRPLAGTVTFTPRVGTILVAGAQPDPVTAFAHPVTAQLDENGYLTLNGKRGVFLLCPSAETNPSFFTYSVRYSVTLDERPVSAPTFDIELVEYIPGPDPQDPDEGSTAVNLTLVTPAQPSAGTPVVRGPKGDTIVEITVAPDGQALVFHIDRDQVGVVDEPVPVPALTAATTAAATATTKAQEATTAAETATTKAEEATTAATTATTKASDAAGSAAAAAQSAQDAADAVGSGIPNATPTVKGGIMLAGDLGGTYDAPAVPALAGKADNGLDYIATYTSGDFNTLDFTVPGFYRVQGGTGYVANAPSTTAGLWWHVLALPAGDGTGGSINGCILFASTTTSNSLYQRVRYGNTWGSWANVNAPLTALTVSEGTTGTATSSRAVRADYLKQVINHYITGSSATSASAIGQALAVAATMADARSAIGAAHRRSYWAARPAPRARATTAGSRMRGRRRTAR
ncbi:hypothetical protein ACYAFX_28905 (plasmid) [Rhodococcus aetherivorans]